MSEKKVLTGRVTKTQKIKLLELMQENRSVGCGQLLGPEGNKKSKKIWLSVAEELNACGGANKSWDQWKKCWVDWKRVVKKQYTAVKQFHNKTGNIPSSEGPKEIEGIDKEMISFFSQDVLEGDSETPEAGISKKERESNDEMDESDLDESIPSTSKPYIIKKEKSIPSTSGIQKRKTSFSSTLEEVKIQYEKRQNQIEDILKKQTEILNNILSELKNTNENVSELIKIIKNKDD